MKNSPVILFWGSQDDSLPQRDELSDKSKTDSSLDASYGAGGGLSKPNLSKGILIMRFSLSLRNLPVTEQTRCEYHITYISSMVIRISCGNHRLVQSLCHCMELSNSLDTEFCKKALTGLLPMRVRRYSNTDRKSIHQP
jgi:hypothetical protein